MKILTCLVCLSLCAINCNKINDKIIKEMPDYTYKNAGIDQFYYSNIDLGNTEIIPLIKPYKISNIGSPKEWYLDTFEAKLINEFGGGISPITYFNVTQQHIYGYKPNEKDAEDSNFDSPEKWFIINTQEKKLTFFEKEEEFKSELKKLKLPEVILNPDEVFEQYINDPVLPWFPEEIKKQLEEAKSKK